MFRAVKFSAVLCACVGLYLLHTPRRRYLLPPGVEGDGERLLGGRQRVGDLGDGLLPRAGQAFRDADTHHAAGGGTELGIPADGALLLRS